MVEVHKVSGAAFDGNVYLVLDEKPILVDAGMMAGPTLKNIKKFIDPAKIVGDVFLDVLMDVSDKVSLAGWQRGIGSKPAFVQHA